MFIQIIQGKCTRQDECREMGERWLRELAPGADGWLGGTYGFTDDDQFLAIVRFESQEAAARERRTARAGRLVVRRWRRSSTVRSSSTTATDVTLMMDGGSDDAGFVQVIRGKVDDADTLKAMMTDTEQLHEMRPDILGGTLAIEADGTLRRDHRVLRRGGAPAAASSCAMPEEVRRAMESAMHDVELPRPAPPLVHLR